MASVREWMRRLWGTLRKNPRDRKMEEELRSHLELAREDALRDGSTDGSTRGSSEDALRAARLKAGGVAQAMEAMRDQRGLPWLDDVPLDADVYTMSEEWETRQSVRGGNTWFVVGRLRPAVTLDQAQTEMSAIARRLNDQLPAAQRNGGISVAPLNLYVVGPQSRLALWMLGGAVFCVFLIAAANVTSLSLARSIGRAREMAVRVALGAGAGRIARQLLTESAVLAALSGLIGTLLAAGGIRLIRAFGPGNLPRLNEISLDFRVLSWALAISVLAGILVGVAPAIATLRRNLRSSVEEGGRSASGGAAARRIRRALVVAEFALAIVLLVGAGLLIRSWRSVYRTCPRRLLFPGAARNEGRSHSGAAAGMSESFTSRTRARLRFKNRIERRPKR